MNGFGVKSNGRDYVDGNMQAGFSYHITKPVNWTELKAAIDKISDESPCRHSQSTFDLRQRSQNFRGSSTARRSIFK
jgi:hypothetical protein